MSIVVIGVVIMFFFIFWFLVCFFFFFFFSSRRRHTRYIGDWSSDVCSSDLALERGAPARPAAVVRLQRPAEDPDGAAHSPRALAVLRLRGQTPQSQPGARSEERRVGKEGRYRGGRDQ